MGDHMEEVLEVVRESLSMTPSSSMKPQDGTPLVHKGHDYDEGWGDAEADLNDAEFDDTGEGAGVEGDLEADED